MNDSISRKTAIKFVSEIVWQEGETWQDVQDRIVDGVSRLPSADRPKGKWIEMGKNKDGTHNVKCNLCGNGYKMRGHANSIATRYNYRFCPHCGAEMKGEKK